MRYSNREDSLIVNIWRDSLREEIIKAFKDKGFNRSYGSIERRKDRLMAEGYDLKKSEVYFKKLRSTTSSLKTKEVEKMMDEKKEMIDIEKLSSSLINKLRGEKKLVKLPEKQNVFTGKKEESAVLMLSDFHCGKINMFPDKHGKSEMTYNHKIAVKEMNRLVESITDINKLLSSSFSIKKLYIFGLGDLLDNEIIVRGQRHFVEAGVGQQLVLAVKIFTDLIGEFLKTFDEVEFILIGGNHGRMTPRREVAPFYNNFDYLLGYSLSLVFKEEKRVKIVSPESWFYVANIHGWNYYLHHGNVVYSWMGFPYYGLVRQGRSRRTEMDIDIECIGHFHQAMEIPISSHSITMVNGCWIQNDDFAWRQYGVLSRPQQWYFGVSKKRPRTWDFKIDLIKEK